jgi:hypothetical protein
MASFLSALVFLRESFVKFAIDGGLITTVEIPFAIRKEYRLMW